ncbi:Glycerate dehydrogenase (GDH) (Glyoxylate reductase) (Hydroxypyruvate dehydrogenase) (NADH-dependent hydroxypyruvate reductase) (HPR) (HPR-A) [Durusdinium trenchii]|uniref:Glycerate dehydrogenase (GDH) (Glyoxylate reductase) (Hydroxypyruvate dehydrogenase) (NADH-dependent hydroxypyruvate reductase) (HPR) (HPR-A) n=1 Tax=Durusdinium trenchii TaxID=1381693 RepID=A0ABP0MN07_9DINO
MKSAVLAALCGVLGTHAAPKTAIMDPGIINEMRPRLPEAEWRLVSLENATAAELAEAEVLCPPFGLARNATAFAGLLQKMQSGKLLQWMAAGVDLINMSAVPSRFAICDVHQGGVAIPEYVLAAILQWNVRILQMDADFRRCTWRDDMVNTCRRPPMHKEVQNQTVGILGLGTIGRGVAERAAGLKMRVCAVDAKLPATVPPYMAWVGTDAELPRLLKESDFVVVSVPLLPQTKGMIGIKELAQMKPDGVLINIARGPIVDEVPLWTALQNQRIGGAVLDVWWNDFSWFQNGTWPSTFNFSSLPNVWMTPHVSVNTAEAHETTLDQAASNLLALSRGKPFQNVVRNASDAGSAGQRPAVLLA